jgi:hypothetical protein
MDDQPAEELCHSFNHDYTGNECDFFIVPPEEFFREGKGLYSGYGFPLLDIGY